MKKRKIALITAAAILLVFVIGCVVYVKDYYRTDETAVAAMTGRPRLPLPSRRRSRQMRSSIL